MSEEKKNAPERPYISLHDEYWARVGVGQVPEIYTPINKEDQEKDRSKAKSYQKGFKNG